MISSKANRAILYLILGFVIANLALVARMNATATFRKEMVDDSREMNRRMERFEKQQELYMERQVRALEKLGVPTQP